MTSLGEDGSDRKVVARLVDAGYSSVERLPASGNNRLYRMSSKAEPLVAKHYFTHVADGRNRLHSEFSFTSFAFQNGICCVPRPIARDDENKIGIYSFIRGKKPEGSDVTLSAVEAALDFLVEINKHRDKAGADFPVASEACFSVEAHVATIQRRVDRLLEVTDARAKTFVSERLVSAWTKVKADLFSEAALRKIKTDKELPSNERIISPSDFGFHNALIGEAGKFYFLDFEYAGWDDPAKTVGDFFSQLAVPVSVEYLGMFARTVAGLTPDPVMTIARIDSLLRLYRIKWCCIALNHFLSTDGERRRFAGNDVDQAKEEQLDKAKNILNSIINLNGVGHGLR